MFTMTSVVRMRRYSLKRCVHRTMFTMTSVVRMRRYALKRCVHRTKFTITLVVRMRRYTLKRCVHIHVHSDLSCAHAEIYLEEILPLDGYQLSTAAAVVVAAAAARCAAGSRYRRFFGRRTEPQPHPRVANLDRGSGQHLADLVAVGGSITSRQI